MSTSTTAKTEEDKCLTCGKQSNFHCPNCEKLSLPVANFCSQECFKSLWHLHKIVHYSDVERKQAGNEFKGYNFTGKLRPFKVTPQRKAPEGTLLPDYAIDSIPHSERKADRKKTPIVVHTPEEIESMREACRIGREALDIAGNVAKIGMTTEEIDIIVHNAIIERGGYPSPLNYLGFPKSCCTSVNETICHGIPDLRPLQDGDILNVDVSVYYKGFHSDLNETFLIGNVDEAGQTLVRVAYECLEKAIAICKPGVMYRELGDVIQKHASAHNLSVVRNFCGHGVGRLFHCNPTVPHYANNKAVGTMKAGHIFTIEPMINEGSWKDTIWPDDWTAVTMDGKRSAQFEQTLLITETGVEILTKRNSGSYIDRLKKE
ncbi:methionine aminopeptidase 1 [Cavenderia fasciculata]|uniref:Methionine aminopeptidase n=1 Tax=Cavenderia fasciculata TaxID=261658 RepID=F4Q7F3_CACFS|nr:methionine aminopeptidase 1 [Cavenderia fasciculata]EGG16335.1 methionine aminopeptidase 1 [Cavenderia fasciculata]|eukprot:XP_004354719.1 methionine aminopeptidase 1 [Cavenderia fasciculata]